MRVSNPALKGRGAIVECSCTFKVNKLDVGKTRDRNCKSVCLPGTSRETPLPVSSPLHHGLFSQVQPHGFVLDLTFPKRAQPLSS